MLTLLFSGLWRDERGQDFIEYALMAALLCSTMGVVMPGWIFPALSQIMSGVTSSMSAASGGS
jgi:Flp pilus assembly pilin Flp